MIDNRVTAQRRTIYFVVCSGCGREGPDSDNEIWAVATAKDLGWNTRTIFPGGQYTEVYTCPRCQIVASFDDSPYTQEYDTFTDADPGL